MSDMDAYKVVLEGPAPWGFRLQGGKDFNMPLSISRLTPSGKAAQAGVGVGDWVLSIDGENASALTHIEAQNRIRACGDRLSLSLSRAQNLVGKPQKDAPPHSEPLKYSFAPSSALNKTARPFGAGTAPVTKPVTYTPLAPASAPQHNGPDKVSAHPLEVRAQAHEDPLSTLGQSYLEDKHSLRLEGPPGVPHSDSSKKRLIEDTEDWRPRTGTTQSRSFRILAQLTGTEFMQDPDDELAKKSREKFFTELQSPRYTRLRDWHHQRSATSLHV
ncbi:PDZ and LIM domain protein 7 [Alligator mississippiensis]|uniref:PDZ and LIM domain protein 7 n=1 Tax=Alligator mississippiensis TaxID=8496 RepID=A0A151NT31_ALLMI|nr:PDZ and LIM domain protein 7 [Alligator mississippiensis]